MDRARLKGAPKAGGAHRPTLEDVARSARVSTATVSRCLNTPDLVVERTRKRVLDAVRELGYSPNFNARALAARRTNTIGAIIPTMENAIFARALQAFQEELGRHGFTLLVSSSSYRADLEEEQIRTLLMRGADALLLIGHERPKAVYDYLERRGVPFLVAWVYDPGAEHLSVGFDNRAAMAELTEKVLDFGHRHIAMITAEQASNDRARARVEGARDALRAHGRDPDGLRVTETTYAIKSGAAAFDDVMSGAPRPTAILCGNDVLAVGAVMAAKAAGLRVPEDVSITGFDDIEIAEIVEPQLTTVHVPHRAMGTEAARRLVDVLNGDGAETSLRLDTYLCLRQTLGPSPR
ncbi:MAG: LacI family DNA-binding transcriptional regulator [Rhodobacteraceae bacterium]|nr:LacI family DNA-binding transcriptional regulator [Paracoccaceae bacterium]